MTRYDTLHIVGTQSSNNKKSDVRRRIRQLLRLPDKRQGVIDYYSLGVVYFVTLTSEGARGLLLPSAWPYLSSVGGTRSLLGVAVGVLSLGRMLVSVPLGQLSDSMSCSEVFYLTSLIQIVGHVLYVSVPSVPILISARFFVGIGSSTASVTRSYIAKAIPHQQRTWHYAILSALQFTGFALLPAVGAAMTLIPTLQVGFLKLDGYTYPAVALAVSAVVVIIVSFLFYDDPIPNIENRNDEETSLEQANCDLDIEEEIELKMAIERDVTTENARVSESVDYLPLITCVITNMVFRGSIAQLETITAPFLTEQYGLSYSSAGAYLAVYGICGLIVYASFKLLSTLFSDRQLIVIGLGVNAMASLPLAIEKISRNLPVHTYATFVGLLWAVGYTVGQTGCLSLYSKALGNIPSGAALGVFSASGSASRIIFAVSAGILWSTIGREAVYISIVFMSLPAMGLVVCAWNKLE